MEDQMTRTIEQMQSLSGRDANVRPGARGATSAEQLAAVEQVHLALGVLDECFRWTVEAIADVGIAFETLRKTLSVEGGPEMVPLHALNKLAATCARFRSQLPARQFVEVDGSRSLDVMAVLADMRRQRVRGSG